MAYLGPTTSVEWIASARPNGFGYKAVVVTRRHAPGGMHFDQTRVVSRTLPTRDQAVARAQRVIEANQCHRDRTRRGRL